MNTYSHSAALKSIVPWRHKVLNLCALMGKRRFADMIHLHPEMFYYSGKFGYVKTA